MEQNREMCRIWKLVVIETNKQTKYDLNKANLKNVMQVKYIFKEI